MVSSLCRVVVPVAIQRQSICLQDVGQSRKQRSGVNEAYTRWRGHGGLMVNFSPCQMVEKLDNDGMSCLY